MALTKFPNVPSLPPPSMTPYHQLTRDFAAILEAGRSFPLGGFPFPLHPPPADGAPKILIFSPHPDDEVIIGGWPLRLLRERGWRVVNVAVTQGSRKDRQEERLRELEACCRYIGFELATLGESGLHGVHLRNRTEQPALWNDAIGQICALLQTHRPEAVVFPHETDQNSTHIGVHFLLMDALQRLDNSLSCAVIESEFWGAMDTPNVMLELSPEQLGDMLAALSFHVGEVRRNPYHLRTASWMIDNVRRGGELVGKQGAAPPDFAYATLYRLRRWESGRLRAILKDGIFLSSTDDVAEALRLPIR